jgi:hypothetical protein
VEGKVDKEKLRPPNEKSPITDTGVPPYVALCNVYLAKEFVYHATDLISIIGIDEECNGYDKVPAPRK